MKDLEAAMLKQEEERKKSFANWDERISSLEGKLSSLESQYEGMR